MRTTFSVFACVACVAAFGGIVLSSQSAKAQALQTINYSTSFETAPTTGWWSNGLPVAGYDENGCCSRSGYGNIWINTNNFNVWDAWNTEFNPSGFGATKGYCNISFWTETSLNFTGGQIDLWEDLGGGQLRALEGYPLSASASYTQQSFYDLDVSPAVRDGRNVLVVIGFWGTGSSQWIRIDDVGIQCWVYD